MKSGNKTEPKKKEKKLHEKEKASNKARKDSKKTGGVDTDFHHMHPFKEQWGIVSGKFAEVFLHQ